MLDISSKYYFSWIPQVLLYSAFFFTYSLTEYLLSTYNAPNTVLIAKNTAVNELDSSSPRENYIQLFF